MAQLSRRRVVEAGVAAVGGLIAAGAAAPDAFGARRRLPQRAAFERSRGRTFTATSGGHRYRLRLREVQDLPAAKARQRQLCFNLVFAPAGGRAPSEGIYRLRRPGFRPTELFISPVGADGRLQALVNRAH